MLTLSEYWQNSVPQKDVLSQIREYHDVQIFKQLHPS